MRFSDIKQLREMKNEWQHVSLSARIINGRFWNFPGFRDRIWVQYWNKNILGVIFISQDGIVLPAFRHLDSRDEQFLRHLLLSSSTYPFSIMGSAGNVLALEKIIHETVFDSHNYHMLTLSGLSEKEHNEKNHGEHFKGLISQLPQKNALTIQRACPSDINALWHLELSYLYEEVLQPDMKLNEMEAKKRFQKSLEKEIIYYAKLGREAVAKAGTNASGWYYDQIGGVFVKPSLRGKGIAQLVMQSLIHDPMRKGRSCCLFVKPKNHAALRLYEKLLFVRSGSFRVSYLNPRKNKST